MLVKSGRVYQHVAKFQSRLTPMTLTSWSEMSSSHLCMCLLGDATTMPPRLHVDNDVLSSAGAVWGVQHCALFLVYICGQPWV